MKLIYIVGMGRSGSTLLDILLDAHSQVQALGGVRRLAHYVQKHPCPCGAPSFRECDFWSRLEQELQSRHGRGLMDLAVNARDKEIFRKDNLLLFQTASKVGGKPYITDNSKSAGRLTRLIQIPEIEVVPVHVIRDPRGRAQSLRKRKNQSYIPTFSYTHRSLRLYRLLRNREHIVVNYEQLAKDPEGQLAKLMHRLDLEFEPDQLNWAEIPHHNIGAADVLRKTKSSAIRPDNAWQEIMPGYMQGLIGAIAWPGRIANDAKERRWG
ncbi:MAG: sulfotransferase family protein, partial [Thermodesulfobacteriota bacterium]